jgi:Fe-S cluster assembly protein SufD
MVQVMDKQATKQTEPYLEAFQRLEKDGAQPKWLFPLRKAGIARFAELGFPTLQHEDWRFTNVAPIAKLPFKQIFPGAANGVAVDTLNQFALSSLDGTRLVFVNGCFSDELSSGKALPAGVKVSSLSAALASEAQFLEKHLGQYARTEGNSFAALNQAFFVDGAFIFVPKGVVLESPIQIIFVSTAKETGASNQPRNLIIAEAGSKLTVVETFCATTDTASFTNAVTELVVGDNASVELLKFQDEAPSAFHVATIQGEFGRGSNVNVHSFALGARLSRNNIRVKLAGEGLECILNGLYLTKHDQVADHHMIVEHAQPHCASHEYFNGILDDKSKGVFHGRILVQQIAQKTDAKQTNKNLLLSNDATVDTKPQLEIYADDVKCTHGATIGQLNEESIFYLRTRGIGTDMARQMLIHAFAGEIIERIKYEPAREELDKLIWDRLEQNPHLK